MEEWTVSNLAVCRWSVLEYTIHTLRLQTGTSYSIFFVGARQGGAVGEAQGGLIGLVTWL